MLRKPGFVLRQVLDEYMVLPTGEQTKTFRGVVVLNDVSAFVWNLLEKPIARDEILRAVLYRYEVYEATAAADLDALIGRLDDVGVLEDTG